MDHLLYSLGMNKTIEYQKNDGKKEHEIDVHVAKIPILSFTDFAPGHVMQPRTVHLNVLDSLFQLDPAASHKRLSWLPSCPWSLCNCRAGQRIRL